MHHTLHILAFGMGALLSLPAGIPAAAQDATTQPASAASDPTPAYMRSGELAAGERQLVARLEAAPNDDNARFELGFVRLLRSVERVSQALHRYGLRERTAVNWVVPMARSPIPPGSNPVPPSYDDVRKILERFVADLEQVDATLAEIKSDDVKLQLCPGMIRLDLNGGGIIAEDETLWRVYRDFFRAAVGEWEALQFRLTLDRGDAEWLRGYCHLLMAMGEFVLAYDEQDLFERNGTLFFQRIQTPYEFLNDEDPSVRRTMYSDIRDLIALVHCINFKLREPERLARAHAHLKAMVAQSRQMWKFVMAEKDDDHEWIPNPNQKSTLLGLQVSAEMVTGWQQFLDEADALLDGKKLVPFWRTRDGRGVNLRRAFLEPRDFDLVLWVQGTAAAPYLERGPLTEADTWRRLQNIFQGDFIGFALWFN